MTTNTGVPISRWSTNLLDTARKERTFLTLLCVSFALAAGTYQTPAIAMWVGFLFAAYSTVANDSIQTIGTFIASNKQWKWWQLWLWIGGIFLATVGYSWYAYGGDVSYGRLMAKGFEKAPVEFQYLQVAAPLFLVVLTRLKMPVSTTFLILSSFAATGKSVAAITTKSLSGYALAFGCSIVLWSVAGPWMKAKFRGVAHPLWTVAQWVTSGFLWSVWLMQDAANIAVYLPRALSGLEFLAFSGVMLLGLGVLFRMGGERIQEVVDEKSHVVDVRAATVINLVYGVILYVFKIWSNIPMSTTWVFIGLLGGRELALGLRNVGTEGRSVTLAARMVARDLFIVTLGFVISLLLASAINPAIARDLFAG